MTFKQRSTGIIALLLCQVVLAAPANIAGDVQVVMVDASVEHQVIDNFGASDCWSMQVVGGWSLENRKRIADLLFSTENGIGLSCWRFNIGAGKSDDITNPWRTVETFEVGEGEYDWSRQANERWFLGAAKARGVGQFVAFANSPPARMTRNGLTRCSEEVGSTNLKVEYEEQYARYLVDILEYFATQPDDSERIAFDWISPVNEPQWNWNERSQEGNRASNADIRRIVHALYDELARRELSTQILAPESGSIYGMRARERISGRAEVRGDYFDALCGDPEVSGKLGGVVAAHSYFVDLVPQLLVPQRERFRKKLDKYPGWRYWMTEYCILQGANNEGGGGRDLTMKTALDVARVIHCDLTICKASAWQWWTAVSPCNFKDGLIYTDYQQPGDAESILPSKTLWALGNYSRFIRPGARRIELTGADDIHGLLGSAYRNAGSGEMVIVFINRRTEAVQVRLQFGGAAQDVPKTLTPYVTSELDDLAAGAPVAAGSLYAVPPRSVVTLVGPGRDVRE